MRRRRRLIKGGPSACANNRTRRQGRQTVRVGPGISAFDRPQWGFEGEHHAGLAVVEIHPAIGLCGYGVLDQRRPEPLPGRGGNAGAARLLPDEPQNGVAVVRLDAPANADVPGFGRERAVFRGIGP